MIWEKPLTYDGPNATQFDLTVTHDWTKWGYNKGGTFYPIKKEQLFDGHTPAENHPDIYNTNGGIELDPNSHNSSTSYSPTQPAPERVSTTYPPLEVDSRSGSRLLVSCLGICAKNSPQRSAWRQFEKQYYLTNSSDPLRSAVKICSERKIKKNLIGPDYANAHERKFCELESGLVIPFCGQNGERYRIGRCWDEVEERVHFVPQPHGVINARGWANSGVKKTNVGL